MLKKYILLLCIFFLISCASSNYTELNNGDLLFVTAEDQFLSGAISRVTRPDAGYSYDHVGIVKKKNGKIDVLHAAPKGGSQKQSLADFLNSQCGNGAQVAVYRLKPPYIKSLPAAISAAESMLGRPYNATYLQSDSSFYCSDFVERAFRKDKIFTLIPMTFKDKKTGKTDPYWVNFYEKLGIAMPEGAPGTNPNQLAATEKLFFVKILPR